MRPPAMEEKPHETDRKQLRAERLSEDQRLAALKARLQAELTRRQFPLFPSPSERPTAA